VESVFEIIAEPNRRAILSLLVSSQQSVGEIERQLRMPQPTVSKHLRVLRDAGFVESTVDAQRRLYRLKPEPLQEVDAWLAPFRRFWSAHVDALERHLDRMDQSNHQPEKEDKEKKMTDRDQYTPGPASGAQIRKDGEKWTLILVRELRHSPEKVWQALTDPAHLREWAPFEADGSLGTVGSHGEAHHGGSAHASVTETRVTRADAPKVLEYNWGDHDVRWELEALGGGTRLTLWTNIDRRFIAMGCCRVAHLFRCSGSPSQRKPHRPHRWFRGDEVRLAAAERRVRPAVRN
jgi:DNA-binding transcriptional ArsR family regulator